MFQSSLTSWLFSCSSREHGISRFPSHAGIVPKPCTYCPSLLTIRLGHHFCFWSPQSLQNSPSGSNTPADHRSSVLGRFIWHPLHMRLSKTHILTRELFTAANVVVKLVQYQCYTTFCSRAEASDVWVDAGYLRWSRIYMYAPRYRGRITRWYGTYNVHITIVYRQWKSRREANWG